MWDVEACLNCGRLIMSAVKLSRPTSRRKFSHTFVTFHSLAVDKSKSWQTKTEKEIGTLIMLIMDLEITL